MKKQKGFTLIELLLVVCVTAILLLMAIGPIGRLYNRFQLKSTVTTNRQMLYNAMTSSHLYDNVIVCFSEDSKHCSGKKEPMIVAFVDINNNGKRDESELLLQRLQNNADKIDMAIRSFRDHNQIFLAKAESQASSNASISVHSNKKHQHNISVSHTQVISLTN